MRKLSLLLVLGLISFPFYLVNAKEKFEDKSEMKEIHRLCEQNWSKCKEYKLEKLKIKEMYLSKERECVEKANSFQEMKQCLKEVKREKHEKIKELHEKFKKQKS